VRVLQIPGHMAHRNLVRHSIVCDTVRGKGHSVHGDMVVSCRHRNIRGYRVSSWVDGEVEGEAVEATF
jgi:hypothetical protein